MHKPTRKYEDSIINRMRKYNINMYRGYGEWIIDRIAKIPNDRSVVVLIRHSERPDFKNIPISEWSNVLLTKRGEEVARGFGLALASDSKFQSVIGHGWGLERCIITAKLIVEGAKSAGCHVEYSTLNGFQSPIQNLNLYENYIKDGKYTDMLNDWFSSNSENGPFRPYVQYSRNIISRMLSEQLKVNNNITVIATHDLHIIPIINYIFGLKSIGIGFLSGMVIAKNGNMLEFFSENSVKQLSINDFRY
jgi:broad specificity phosphatase PhoE